MSKIIKAFLGASALLATTACSSMQENNTSHALGNTITFDDILTFSLPESAIEPEVSEFLLLNEIDRDFLFLQGENQDLLTTDNPNKIRRYLKKRFGFNHEEKQQIRQAFQEIQSTPIGQELLDIIHDKYDIIHTTKTIGIPGLAMYQSSAEYAMDHLGSGETREFGGYANLALDLDTNMAYDCPNGSPIVPPLSRIIFHELYHFAHHIDPSALEKKQSLRDLLSIRGQISLEDEEETVKATDTFAMELNGLCPRNTYSNGYTM